MCYKVRKKLIEAVMVLFILTILQVKAQKKDSVKFKITPNIFDSTVTFSFYIPTADSVDLFIVDRWAHTVATVIPLKYFSAGEHDTICNLSALPPKKYLAQLGVGRTTIHLNRIGLRRVSVTQVQEKLTRRSQNADKKRDNYTDTTKYDWKNK